MKKSAKTLEFKFERTIPAPPRDVFDAWLNPKIPGNPWNMADKFLLNPKVDGFFYWTIRGTAHYGIYRDEESNSDSAYLGVAEHLGGGVDGHCELQETGRRHADDPRAFRPSRL